jgi:hypothetical protein
MKGFRMSTGRATKGSNVVPMTITVPQTIRRKMDGFQREHYVNWSEVAAKAFAAHVEWNSNWKDDNEDEE